VIVSTRRTGYARVICNIGYVSNFSFDAVIINTINSMCGIRSMACRLAAVRVICIVNRFSVDAVYIHIINDINIFDLVI
jgi:hypothetical protein